MVFTIYFNRFSHLKKEVILKSSKKLKKVPSQTFILTTTCFEEKMFVTNTYTVLWNSWAWYIYIFRENFSNDNL